MRSVDNGAALCFPPIGLPGTRRGDRLSDMGSQLGRERKGCPRLKPCTPALGTGFPSCQISPREMNSIQGVHTIAGPLSLCNVERSHHRTKHFIRGVMGLRECASKGGTFVRLTFSGNRDRVQNSYSLQPCLDERSSVLLASDLVRISQRCGDELDRRSIPDKVSSGCAAVPVINKGVSAECLVALLRSWDSYKEFVFAVLSALDAADAGIIGCLVYPLVWLSLDFRNKDRRRKAGDGK
jgi:hypothetical protein